MQALKAIIIGSGVAGMAIAIRLALKGYNVSVFEKNSFPGGKLSSFKKDGYLFDAGPSLFTQPQNIEELFALAGVPIEGYFTYKAVPVANKYFYENGKQVKAYTDAKMFAQEMKDQLGEDPQTVLNYLKQSEILYKNVGALFLDHSLHLRKTWFQKSIGKALATLTVPYVFQSLHQYNKRKFTTPEAVQLFNRFATYNGSNPYKTPAMLSLIPHLEQNQGTFYPNGGMISITNSLHRLAKEKGVEFYFDAPVQQIVEKSGSVKGVIVNDEMIEADIVVSNSDVYYTYKNLLQNTDKAKQVLKQERSSSAVIFYWGIKKEFRQLELHNIFF